MVRSRGTSCTLVTSEVGLPPNIDLHDLIEPDAVFAPVVKLGRTGGRMRRHLARLFERATVLEVGGNASAAEGVICRLRW